MKKPLISIIITNYNAKKWLDACLSSIKNQPLIGYEVLVVDDGSTDGSFEYIKKNYPWCLVIKNNKNVGFAGSNNYGAAHAKGKYIFFLNADTYLEKDTLTKLSKTLQEHPLYHICQLDIRKYDKSNMRGETCTFTIDRFGYPMWSGKNINPFYADAAAMIIKKNLFLKIGKFDKRFYIYLEDLDLAWRARLVGEEVFFLPKIYAYHYAGGTSVSTHAKKGVYMTTARRRYDAQKNNLCILIKNLELKNLLWVLPGSIALASVEGFLYLLKGNFAGFLALHNAILWNILNIQSTLNNRALIQNMRIVSDSIIFTHMDNRISKIESFHTYGIPYLNHE